MSAMSFLQQPFFQITLPLLFGLWLASWYSGKRFDDLKNYFDGFKADMLRRLDKIDARLEKIDERLTAVERKVDGMELRAWR